MSINLSPLVEDNVTDELIVRSSDGQMNYASKAALPFVESITGINVDNTDEKNPIISFPSTYTETFEYVSGAQTFALAHTAPSVLLVTLNGQVLNRVSGAPLQYQINANTELEILDTLTSGDYVSIVYSTLLWDTAVYSKSEVDSLIADVETVPFLGSVSPTDTPTGTGEAFWIAAEAGTYTNFGGVVVDPESFAVISRDAANAYSISQTTLANDYIQTSDLTIVTVGKNLFNPDVARIGYRVLSDGTLSPIVGEVTSADIPASEGEDISFSGCSPSGTKYICYKDSLDATISLDSFTGASTTKTAPTGTAYFYASVIRATVPVDIDTVMIEKSDAVTTFEPYEAGVTEILGDKLIANKLLIDGELVNTEDLAMKTYDLKLYVKSSLLEWYVRIPYSDTQDLVHTWGYDPNNTTIPEYKNVIKVANTTEDTDAVFLLAQVLHNASDDICPIRLDQTGVIGAGHGLITQKVTLVAHGKTSSDLTSEWTDGTYNWYLIEIQDADTIVFMAKEYTFPKGVAIPEVFASNTLTHVAGGVNTSSINVTTRAKLEKFPSCADSTVKLLLDNVEVTEAGLYTGNEFQLLNSYKIIDPRNVTIQTPFVPNEGGYLLEHSIVYTYDKTNTCKVDTTTNFLTEYAIEGFGFTQSRRFITGYESANTTLLYIPNSGSVSDGTNTYNLATTPVNVFNSPFLGSLFYGVGNVPDPDVPINRVVQVEQTAGGVKKNGYAHGFSYELGVTIPENRKVLTQQWEIRGDSAKSYPAGIYDFSADNDVLQSVVYRTYYDASLNPNATAVYCYKENASYYLFIDYHQSVSKELVIVPDYLKGKKIEIVEQGGTITLFTNDYVPDSAKLMVSVTTYGYVILKLT